MIERRNYVRKCTNRVWVFLVMALLGSSATNGQNLYLYSGTDELSVGETYVNATVGQTGILIIDGGRITGELQIGSSSIAPGQVTVIGTEFKWNGADVDASVPLPVGGGGTLSGSDTAGAFSIVVRSISAATAEIILQDTGSGEPPAIEALTVTIPDTPLGQTTVLTATFTGPANTLFTGTVNWGGEGAVVGDVAVTEDPGAPGEYTATASYKYALASEDAYAVVLEVTAGDLSASSEAFASVSVESTNGFAAGAGWIPWEAAPRGKAFFGFVCRSVWWSDSPRGGLRLRVGEMRFRSTGYDWLSVSEDGSGAWFAGWGTINGEGDYYFMVETGGDSIWITIYNQDGYGVEYDTEDLVSLGGGRIRVRYRE